MVLTTLRHPETLSQARSGGVPPAATAARGADGHRRITSRRRAVRAPSVAALAASLALVALAAPVVAQETTPAPADERPRLPADSVVVQLEPLDVRVSPPPRRGKMAGFQRRKSRGMGEFITREDIERQDPMRLSDMVHLRTGVGTVAYGDGSGRRHVEISRAAFLEDNDVCRVQYWIDGVPFPGVNRFEMDELSPQDVEAIEIYRGPSEIPPRFNRRGSQCGVVAVWTRDPTGG